MSRILWFGICLKVVRDTELLITVTSSFRAFKAIHSSNTGTEDLNLAWDLDVCFVLCYWKLYSGPVCFPRIVTKYLRKKTLTNLHRQWTYMTAEEVKVPP